MSNITQVLLTGKTRTTGADSAIFSGNHEGKLNIALSAPGNASARSYVFEAVEAHPTAEQLFAGAWSACYSGAVGIVAKQMNVTLPADTAVEIEVDLGVGGGAYFIQARLNLIVPGIAPDVATAIAHGADAMCPYSKATKGNIDVVLSVVTN
ncbi:Ohr family peroxiredoxin [Duganella aceris]|jgi:Ohr subfamily peroxiredoxin|uniref:Ohr family peroxiredoxin n=1 Tax=Duganella aceris TaxID=2703883 RepID=A0ABX0FRB0_9BURK|nr:Ohr family peroxiredoxin [Duganella aceris]NGZ86884.1 Ohr family peroxiredoxin [Duganella aceris]